MVLPLSEPELVIGNSDSADIVLEDEFVSRRHALITIADSGTVTIHDLNSTGGTFVNDERLTGPRNLRPGDLVRFANVEARFEAPEPTAGSTDSDQTRVLPVTLPPAEAAPVTAAPPEAANAPVQDKPVVMPPGPIGAPVQEPGLTISDVAQLLGPDGAQLVSQLAAHGIRTLADVRHAGSLSAFTTPAEAAAVRLLEQHADLARLSPDVTVNAALIDAGLGSSLAVATAPQSEVIAAAAPILGATGAIGVQVQAVAMYHALDQVMIGAKVDSATALGTGLPVGVNHIIDPPASQVCSCDDCQSAPSPAAYLADLLAYIPTRLQYLGQPASLPFLVDTFHQPFGSLPTDCEAVETLVRQVRICAEVLRSYLGSPGHAPSAAQATALAAAEASYVLSVYESLLVGLGTSYEEVRLARYAGPATRSALAGRLGLTIDPYGGGRPDVLDDLVLDPAAVPPSPQVLTEDSVERMFGLASTTRNPLSDGPTADDSAGLIYQWNLTNVTWGLDTDPDGTIYVAIDPPSGSSAQLQVELFKDEAQTQLVGSGQLVLPVTFPAPVTIGPENNSGLTGTLTISSAAGGSGMELGAVPLISSWQLQSLRSDWQIEDHPADGYTAGTSVAPLAALPASVTFPAALSGLISYDAAAQILSCTGVMTPADLAELIALPAPADPAGPAYVSAVNALYVLSQRPPVIDPDVIGPDDFRSPFPKAAPTDPDQPYDLWLSRRAWVVTQLTALQGVTAAAPAGTAFTAMLTWMYNPLSYQTTSAAPWAGSTPVSALQNLSEDLAEGVNVAAITTQIAGDLGLSVQAFNRLIALWQQDQAAAADPRNPALTSDNWLEVAYLLTEAVKTRFFAAWLAEEAALPVTFGPVPFVVSLTEPQVGDWPPVLPAGTPLIDPSMVALTGLPDPVAGATAIAFWQARQAQETNLTATLRTTNQSGGFQAMLEQALGDPDAGDPLPVDIDTLAAQLIDPDPAVVATATATIQTQLFMTADEFSTIMTARTMDASANPLDQPTAAQWMQVYAILTAAETQKRLWPEWLTQEANPVTGVTYWTALKAALPLWRASTGQRAQWQSALAARSQAPIVDPDLIGPADMVNPVTGDTAFDLWNARSGWVDALAAAAPPTTAAEVDAALQATLGISGDDLAALAAQSAAGANITARLAQLTLTYPAFTELMGVRSLIQDGVTVLASELQAFQSILVEVAKQRQFAVWLGQEADAGLLLGPDEFVPGAPSPVLTPWRASSAARSSFEQTLQARAEQQGTVLSAAVANADATEAATLTSLRDALVAATDAPGGTLQQQADWLTTALMIDAETGGTVKTTRIEQAIETLQDVMTGVRNGQIGDFDITLTSAPSAVAVQPDGSVAAVFARGPDLDLWCKWWDGSWGEWASLGSPPPGGLGSGPVAISDAPGNIDVYAQGSDNALWYQSYRSGGWIGWQSLGGILTSGPGAVAIAAGNVDVFVLGSDHGLWRRSLGGSGWGSWQAVATAGPPAGGFDSAPSVVVSAGGYEVFIQGGDHALWHARYDGTWSAWTTLHGYLTSGPSAVASGGSAQVFARGGDDAIWSISGDLTGSWGSWTSLGGYASHGPGALGENDVFTAGGAGCLEHKWLDGAVWQGWLPTTGLILPMPSSFDAEWVWMGSYATWRSAIMAELYPENLLDPSLREQQTPAFQSLVSALQNGGPLTAQQAQDYACQYDSYFRDVCSIDVQTSCTVWSRLDSGEACGPGGTPQSATLLDMFGIAASSNTAYWSTYNASDGSGYAQTFWNVIPALTGQLLIKLCASTVQFDSLGKRWVLLVVSVQTSDGPALAVTRYDPAIPGQGGWEGQVYSLDVPSGWTSFTAQLAFQDSAQDAAWIGAMLPDGSRYERQLNADGTGWADSDWVQLGVWTPWALGCASPIAANLSSTAGGGTLVVVSRNPDQVDLFWSTWTSPDGGTYNTTIWQASSNLQVNSGQLSSPQSVVPTFTASPMYLGGLSAVSRTGTSIDLLACSYTQANGSDAAYYATSWDANANDGQWQEFQQISPIGFASRGVNPPTAVATSADRLDVVAFNPTEQVCHAYWDGSWHAFEVIGGGPQPDIPPAAVSQGADRLEVFAVDYNSSAVWQNSLTIGGSWSGWTSLGVPFPWTASDLEVFSIVATASSATRIDLLYTVMNWDTNIQYCYWNYADAGLWHTWAQVPTGIYGQPAAVSPAAPGRLDLFAVSGWPPGTPGPTPSTAAVYTAWRDDQVAGGAWQPWSAVSAGTGTGDIIQVVAVSRAPDRIDLLVGAGGLGSDSAAGIYTCYRQDDSWDSAALQLPPFSPVPVVTSTTPLDIPDYLSSDDLQTRRYQVETAFEANAAVPHGFTKAAPASTMTYFQEAYYFVPVYLANQLAQQGQYTAALDWYRTTYDYSVPPPIRDIYYGLVQEESLPAFSELPAGWLDDPMNPHAIALTRRDAYTRYTVLQIVSCMFAYADSLFTTDTSESDAEARTWYMSGLALLSLPIFSEQTDPCAGLTIQVLDTPVSDPAWEPVLGGLAAWVASVGQVAALTTLVPEVTAALAGDAASPDRFAAARAAVADSLRSLPPAPTVQGVLATRQSMAQAAYSALLAMPAVDGMATAVSAAAGTAFRLAAFSAAGVAEPATADDADAPEQLDAPAGKSPGGDASPVTVAKMLPVKTSGDLTDIPAPGIGVSPPAGKTQPYVDFWFCVPVNPVLLALQTHGETCLYELRNGMNIAGMSRQLSPYSAAVGAGTGLPAAQATAPTLPTPYPFPTLMARAQQLVQTAQQIEAEMLSALEQADQATYAEMQARQNLAVATSTVQLQSLSVQQATDSVAVAQLQQQSAQMQGSYWQQMMSSDISSLEQSAISDQWAEAGLQVSAAAAAYASLANPIADVLGTSSLATALSDTAGSLGTFAAVNNARASLESQQDNWQFQYDLSQENAQIAGQQIVVANDQLQVANQQLSIAQLQASNATDTLNFLVNQFTNAPLFTWMAGVLQGVYSYFLQEATAVALQAQNQMAFERQQVPPAFIQSNYWQPAAANLAAATTPGSSGTLGLTGAEQLDQDLTELNEYYLSTDQRKLQLTTTISLAQLYPVDFQSLRETGVMNFTTPMSLFDQQFPGHYLRLIQQVSVSVIALIPATQAICATLSASGTSQVVVGPDVFQTVPVQTGPQSIAITTPTNATGVLNPDPQSGLLFPFQGMGVAAQWEYAMPLPANPWDFSTLADVQVTIAYTALASPQYQAQVIAALAGQVSQERPYSFVNDLPDQWYDLNNPAQTATPMTVQFQVAATDFPPNLTDIRIQQLTLAFALAEGASFEVAVQSLQFFEGDTTAAVGGAATTVGGVISTRQGNAAAWIPIIGSSPIGTWQLALADTQIVQDWFSGQQITDILFDITYSASTPSWPT